MKGYEFVVRNSKGQIYNFYLNEKKQIEYIVTNEKNQWAKKRIVMDEAVDSYSLEIDDLDIIHMAIYSKNEQIYYTTLVNNQWAYKKLLDYSHKKVIVCYPSIKLLNNQVYIFYYLKSQQQKNKCKLFLLSTKDKKWVNEYILDASYEKVINSFNIIYFEDQLYILFTTLYEDYSQLFIANFDRQLLKLKEPIRLTNTAIEKLYVNYLLQNSGDLHIIWSSYDDTGLTVQYMKQNLADKIEIAQPQSISEKSNCSFPLMLQYDNILWSTWLQMNKLFTCYSTDYGDSWSAPLLCKESQNANFKQYRFRSNYTNDKENMVCDFLFGSLYPKIQFIGFGGDVNDEISKDKS